MKLFRHILAFALISFCSLSSMGQITDKVEDLRTELRQLVRAKNWYAAQEVIADFYATYPKEPSELQRVERYEVSKFETRVDEGILQDELSYLNLLENQTVSACQKYLSDQPFGKYRQEVSATISAIGDEDGWLSASRKNTIPAYQNYLDTFVNGKYRTDAERAISELSEAARLAKIQAEEDAYQRAKKSRTVTACEQYLSSYPSFKGRYAQEVSSWLSEAYLREADGYFNNKSYSLAKSYYTKYINQSSFATQTNYARKQIEICKKHLNRKGMNPTFFQYDALSPIGLCGGVMRLNKSSWYFGFKMNLSALTTLTNGEVDNRGNVYTSNSGNYRYTRTGESKYTNYAMSSGILFPIRYPFWGYGGIGLGYFEQVDEVNQRRISDNKVVDTIYMENIDETKGAFFPECGLILKVSSSVALKGGWVRRGENYAQWGIGIRF